MIPLGHVLESITKKQSLLIQMLKRLKSYSKNAHPPNLWRYISSVLDGNSRVPLLPHFQV